jgi:Fasciclin domain
VRRRPAVIALLVLFAFSSCTDSGGGSDGADSTNGRVASPGTVSGPLCDLLPTGAGPGGLETLTNESADEALKWMPVLSIFEAGARASGLAAELGEAEGLTILAPTDEAFVTTFSEDELDDLLISRRRALRGLLRGHMIEGRLSIAQMLDERRVTTLAGNTIDITPRGDMARLGDQAETVCANYRVANARIHIIDGLLGELPAFDGGP